MGRRLPDAPSPRPSSRTASAPAPTTGCASPGPTAAGDVEIETTRPELLAACVALVAHPDDERYAAAVRHRRGDPALLGVGCPCVAHELAEPDKGSGIAMVCTFGDTTDVLWWRELGLPTRTIVGRDGRPRTGALGRARLGVRRPRGGGRATTASWPAGPSARPRPGSSSSWPRRASSWASPGRSPTRSSSTSGASGPSRSSRPASGSSAPSRLRDRLLGARRASCAGTRRTWRHRYRSVGRGAQHRLEHQPPALLRGALSRCGTRSTTTGPSTTTAPLVPDRGPAPGRPVDRRPRRLPRGPAGPARRLRRRPRRHGHLGHVARSRPRSPGAGRTTPTCSPGCSPWTCAPRPTRSSAPGCSRPWCAPSSSSARCRGPTPPSRAGCSTRTARRCPSPRATWSPPCPCSSATAPTPCATGRPAGGPGPTPRSTRAR